MKIKLHPLKVFENRNFVLLCTLAVSTLVITYTSHIAVKISLLAASFVLGVFFALKKRTDKSVRYKCIMGLAMVFLLVLSSVISFELPYASSRKHFGNDVEVYAYAVPNSENKIRVLSLDGEDVSLYAVFSGGELPEKYETFTCCASVTAVRTGRLSSDMYYLGDGIDISVYAEDIISTGERYDGIGALMYSLNRSIRNIVYEYCDDGAGLVSALFLGNKSDLPESVKSDFSHTGVSHIVAISGMHVMIAAAFASVLLKKVIPHIFVRLALLDITVIMYSLLVGGGLSVVRAALMYTVVVIASYLGEETDTVTSLFLALYLICLVQPHAIFDISLQLSFCATFGIAVFALPACRRISKYDNKKGIFGRLMMKKLACYAVTSLLISVCAVAATLPLCFLYFGRMSLLSPVVTLLTVPFVSLILYCAPLMAAFGALPPIAQVFAQVCDSSAQICIMITSFFRDHANIELSFSYPFSALVIIIFAVLTVALVIKGVNKRRVYAIVCLSACLTYAASTSVFAICRADKCEVVYTSYNGDILCRVDGNSACAVDITNGYGKAHTSLFRVLEEKGIVKLDRLILTHCGESHAELIKRIDSRFGVKSVIYPSDDRYSDAVGYAVEEIGAEGVEYESNKTFSCGGFTIEQVHYISAGEGYNITTSNAVYFSGSRADERSLRLVNAESVVFYGCYSKISQMAFTPVYGVDKAIVTSKLKNNMFTPSEYENYISSENVIECDGTVTVDISRRK